MEKKWLSFCSCLCSSHETRSASVPVEVIQPPPPSSPPPPPFNLPAPSAPLSCFAYVLLPLLLLLLDLPFFVAFSYSSTSKKKGDGRIFTLSIFCLLLVTLLLPSLLPPVLLSLSYCCSSVTDINERRVPRFRQTKV